MPNDIVIKIFKFANIFYRRSFLIYKPLYFFYKRISDRNKINLIKGKILPGMTVIDIGANIGFYSILFSKLVGESGCVYAFEPDEENFEKLKKNTRNFKNITIVKAAIVEKDGKIKLYRSNKLNVDHQTYDSGEGRTYKEVDGICLDNYFQKDFRINMIKIDIQGYDYFAIKGTKEIIRRSNGLMIIGELWPYGLCKAGVSHTEYISMLKDLGFVLQLLDHESINLDYKVNDKNFYIDFYGIKK